MRGIGKANVKHYEMTDGDFAYDPASKQWTVTSATAEIKLHKSWPNPPSSDTQTEPLTQGDVVVVHLNGDGSYSVELRVS